MYRAPEGVPRRGRYRLGLALGVLAVSVARAAAPEPAGFWTGPVNSPVPATVRGGKVIHARKLSELLKGRRAVIVDVSNAPRRPENLPASTPWLPLPHQAIPGAIWIPGAGLGAIPGPIEKFYRERLASATGSDTSRTVVVYCHARCWLSWNGAKRAIQYGYRNVYWFPDGIEGWRAAHLPTRVIAPEPTP
ncbi:MAG TPA: rhodanese-like domain-containing protein [Steroidobacteraceae bacterium]|nr:rhodanese-like domain-containing protein [Steroidobacteraceae bacterium]